MRARIKAAVVLCGWTMVMWTTTTRVEAAARQETPGAKEAPAQNAVPADRVMEKFSDEDANVWMKEPATGTRRSFSTLVRDFVGDQKAIWTSPSRLRVTDGEWLLPLAGITVGLFVTDRQVSGHLAADPKTQQHYRSIATDGALAMAGVGGGMAVWSVVSHSEHQRETGFLSGEAAVDSLVVAEAMKYAFARQRPYQGNGSGHFFSGGTSFPSEHSAAAWSIAGIIAHEYPGKLPALFAYGLATAISVSRIQSRDHFPSDVLVGSALGYLVSQYVYRRHHDPELSGGEWRSPAEWVRDSYNSPGNIGSPYVPLDSWIYPALDRLAAMGLSDSGFAGMRPWTRRECARLVSEAAETWDARDMESEAAGETLAALQREFRVEIAESTGGGAATFRMESLYSRTEHISGAPLNDGYHFAQTQINDFGRPYGEGFSTVNGFSSYATRGRWVTYVRGEVQTAPGVPALSLAARETIQTVDVLPGLPPDTARPAIAQASLLDAYVGFSVSDWQLTFGRQSLWWAPGDGGPMMMSDNIAPMNMFRINRVAPLEIPWVSRFLGPIRLEIFLGQLTGQHFENDGTGTFMGSFTQPLRPQPLVHGEKINFHPTRNFEFGLSRTAVFGGPTDPLTLGTYLHSLFPNTNQHSKTVGQRDYTGDQQSELDWSYRLPKLRDWLTFYGDAYADDQISPIAYWDRSAIHAGLYLAHVPGIAKLDLRAEGVYTDPPAGGALSHGFYYYSTLVPEGKTSNGYLFGNWVGREGQGAQAWTNYWFNARNRVQINFRHQKVSQQFIPGGGSLTDVGARGDYWTRFNVGFSASVQYERWLFPVIQPNHERNVTAMVQVTFEPQKWFRRGGAINAEGGESEVQP